MIKRLKNALQSVYLVPAIFIVGFLCWVCNLTLLGIGFMAAIVALILLLCKDVKNIFAIVLYCGYFINDIMEDPNWLFYGICIGVAVISFIVFIVRTFITLNALGKKPNFGKLALPLLIMDIGLLLAGVIGHFNFTAFIITLGFNVSIFLLYLIALNSTENLTEFFFKLFLFGGIYLTAAVFVTNVRNGGIKDIFTMTFNFVGAVNVNTVALMLILGIISCFKLSLITDRFKILYTVISFLFAFTVIVTKCRIGILFAFILFVFWFIYCLKTENHVKACVISYVVFIVITGVLFLIFRDILTGIINKIKSGMSGRGELWSWCFERFKENPIFGYGYVGDEICPIVREGSQHFALAHNTALQWITSTGVIGTLLTVPFYVAKYKLLSKNFKRCLFAVLCVLTIALMGMIDQSPSMDPFIYMLPLLIMAGIEKE